MRADAGALRRLRHPPDRVLYGVIGVVGLTVWVGGIVSALTESPGEQRLVPMAIVLLIVAVLWTVVMVRLVRSGVYVSRDRLRIANTFRTYDLAWGDVEWFVPEARGFYPSIVVAYLTDGREILVVGIQAARNPEPVVALAEELNDLVDEAAERRGEEPGVSLPGARPRTA